MLYLIWIFFLKQEKIKIKCFTFFKVKNLKHSNALFLYMTAVQQTHYFVGIIICMIKIR